jgi:hypothetical protein
MVLFLSKCILVLHRPEEPEKDEEDEETRISALKTRSGKHYSPFGKEIHHTTLNCL